MVVGQEVKKEGARQACYSDPFSRRDGDEDDNVDLRTMHGGDKAEPHGSHMTGGTKNLSTRWASWP
jgi:hypothetical protein